jgi:hypothetical protein
MSVISYSCQGFNCLNKIQGLFFRVGGCARANALQGLCQCRWWWCSWVSFPSLEASLSRRPLQNFNSWRLLNSIGHGVYTIFAWRFSGLVSSSGAPFNRRLLLHRRDQAICLVVLDCVVCFFVSFCLLLIFYFLSLLYSQAGNLAARCKCCCTGGHVGFVNLKLGSLSLLFKNKLEVSFLYIVS